MPLTAAEYLVIAGGVAFTMTVSDLMKHILWNREADDPRRRAKYRDIRRKLSKPGICLGSITTVVAWGLALIFHWANWDPLSHIPTGTGKILFVAALIALAVALEVILVWSRVRFIRKRIAESGSLSEKDIAGLKKLDAFIWKSSLFLAACIAVVTLLRH